MRIDPGMLAFYRQLAANGTVQQLAATARTAIPELVDSHSCDTATLQELKDLLITLRHRIAQTPMDNESLGNLLQIVEGLRMIVDSALRD